MKKKVVSFLLGYADTTGQPIYHGWPFHYFYIGKKRKFIEKRLAFTPKIRKLSLTRQAASTKYNQKRKVENIMKTGKITAKLRDEVLV